jgi:hypothetical protein
MQLREQCCAADNIGVMNRALRIAILAATAATTAAIAPVSGLASAHPAHAASGIADFNISVLSDGSDAGYYVWDAQLAKDPTDPTYNNVSVLSGSTRFFWTWPAGGGSSHNVKLKVGVNFLTKKPFSTPGVDFFGGKGSGSPFTNDTGSDVTWPTRSNGGVNGWVPTKAGTYYLFCSQHSGMYMRVMVKSLVSKVSAKQKTLRAGARSVGSSVSAATATTASAQIVLCTNSSCSKSKKIAAKQVSLKQGSNSVNVATKALSKGRYELRVISNGNVTSSQFTVKG